MVQVMGEDKVEAMEGEREEERKAEGTVVE